MNSANIRKALYNCLWVLALAGFILSMAALAESSPLAGDCGDDCTNECDSPSEDCNYCLNCPVTTQLAKIIAFDHSPFEAEPSRASLSVVLPVEQNLSFDIDHPPQIHP